MIGVERMSRRIGDKDIWVRTFEISNPTKHQKGFTVYKVVSTVFPRSFPEGATRITVWKRYNDFKKLHKELELLFRHLYLKGDFPKLPKDQMFGRFEDALIEERRKSSLNLLQFAASYAQLFTHKVFVKFFETGYHVNDLEGFNKKPHNLSDVSGVTFEEDTLKSCECLIPEKVWTEPNASQIDDDAHSLSSFTCSSPDAIVENELMTNASESSKKTFATDQQQHSKQSGFSEPPRVTTFSDSSVSANISIGSDSQFYLPSTYTLQEARRNLCMVSSTSLTEDLNTILEDDAADAQDSHSHPVQSLVSNSISCLSLDTLTTRKTFREPNVVSNSSSSSSKPNKSKKLNGFGFFDFLPIFSKDKKEENKVSREKLLAESLSAPYICEAAGHFTVAHHHESNGDYEIALEAYMEGIKVLLEGAKCDTDQKRKLLAKNKVEKYLSQAEVVKMQLFLEKDQSSSFSKKPSSPIQKLKSLVPRNSSCEDGFVVLESNVLPSSLEELKVYKIVGYTFNNLLVAVDTTAKNEHKCYAIKVIRKSAVPLDPEKPTLIPSIVPFMVQLIKWCNTEDCLILVLQYAGGGRLINFVENYQSKMISPIPLESIPCSETQTQFQISSISHEVTNGHKNVSVFLRKSVAEKLVETEAKRKSNLESEKENKSESVTKVEEKSESEMKEFGGGDGSTSVCVSFEVASSDNSKASLNESSYCVTKESQRHSKLDLLSGDQLDRNERESLSQVCNARPGKKISLDLETNELIENSRVLIQTVSQALQEQREKSHDSNSRFVKSTDSVKEKVTDQESAAQSSSKRPPNLNLFPGSKNASTIESRTNFLNPNSPSYDNADDFCIALKRMVPECCVKVWAAEIVLALDKLHTQGITYGDLDINNILLAENGHIVLSYRALWNEVDTFPTWNDFSAPEVRNSLGKSLWKVHPSADWWSLGAILFLLVTGQTFKDIHPEGIHQQTVINVPSVNCCDEMISPSAKTLLVELLQFSPQTRLGYYGAEEIKTHPFFEGFDWDGALNEDQLF